MPPTPIDFKPKMDDCDAQVATAQPLLAQAAADAQTAATAQAAYDPLAKAAADAQGAADAQKAILDAANHAAAASGKVGDLATKAIALAQHAKALYGVADTAQTIQIADGNDPTAILSVLVPAADADLAAAKADLPPAAPPPPISMPDPVPAPVPAPAPAPSNAPPALPSS